MIWHDRLTFLIRLQSARAFNVIARKFRRLFEDSSQT